MVKHYDVHGAHVLIHVLIRTQSYYFILSAPGHTIRPYYTLHNISKQGAVIYNSKLLF
jgi:hypothetical protein